MLTSLLLTLAFNPTAHATVPTQEQTTLPASGGDQVAPMPQPAPQLAAEQSTPVLSTTVAGKTLEVKVGAHAFERGAVRINGDFDAKTGHSQPDIQQRIRLDAKATLGASSVFVQFQDARRWGFEASVGANEANTDLYQGYYELGGQRVAGDDCVALDGYLRVGRQELVLGTKRLVSHLGWAPLSRSFDALAGHGRVGKASGDVFVAVLSPAGNLTVVDDSIDPPVTSTEFSGGGTFSGLHLGFALHEAFNFEPMALLVAQNGTAAKPKLDETYATLGARAAGKIGRVFSYDVEGYAQVGQSQKRDHIAWAGAGQVALGFGQLRSKPSFYLRYSLASGESCTGGPADGCGAKKSTEFRNLYPLNHAYYGLMDLLGWRNMRDLEFRAALAPDPRLSFSATYHFFQLQEAKGRWSNAGGANVGAGWDPTNKDNNLGHEIDVVLTYNPVKQLMIEPGYGIFLPSGAGKTLGGDDPQHFLYLWLVANFS